ncbi:hypothetical protein DMX06_09050 [Pseudomonas mosselii]|nr:hypothetical protein DMX06_09050 [Pseudomonas mosselii]
MVFTCQLLGNGQTTLGFWMGVRLEIAGAALQPFRDTRPLPQGFAVACGSGLAGAPDRSERGAKRPRHWQLLI